MPYVTSTKFIDDMPIHPGVFGTFSPGESVFVSESVRHFYVGNPDFTIDDSLSLAAVNARLGAVQKIAQFASALKRKRTFDSAVMSSPPTFAESADFASGSIAGAVFVSLGSSNIYKSTPLFAAYSGQGRDVYKPSPGAGSGTFFSFATDAQAFEIDLQTGGFGIPILLIVDGEFASATAYNGTPPASGNIRRQWKFTFPTKKIRHIQVLNSGIYNGIAGIFVGPRDVVIPWNPGLDGGLVAISDSYGGFAYGAVPHGGPAIGLIDAAGYAAAVQQYGGSGYYATNGFNGYEDRLRANIAAQAKTPAIVYTAGGINDPQSALTTKAAIDSYFSYCAASVPDALHIVMGPWCPKQSYINGTDKYTEITSWINSALRNSGLKYYIFLDTVAGGWETGWGTSRTGSEPWITGSGYVGGTTGTGNADIYISNDQTHPSSDGVEYLLRRTDSEVVHALSTLI